MTINTVRHHEVFDSSKYSNMGVVVVGGGAIGSRVIENLASTGLTNLTLIDPDKVESHNLANQLYLREDIGVPKVVAAKRWCYAKLGEDSAEQMRFIEGWVDEHSLGWFTDATIVVSCVDTFKARAIVMQMAQDSWASLFIEAGMATQHINVFMVDPDNSIDVKAWEETLGDDDDPSYETSACGESLSVGVTAQVAGAVIAWQVMNYMKTGYMEKKIRVDTTPFMIGRHSQR